MAFPLSDPALKTQLIPGLGWSQCNWSHLRTDVWAFPPADLLPTYMDELDSS